jgi:outer membrane protein OmpA-like peptidoglycan-associated protein
VFKGSGSGFSRKIMVNNTYEDKIKSRRVSFKIVLNETK